MTAPKTFQMWVTVIRWVDGDTFTGVLDQGYGSYRGRTQDPIRFRCAIINAPETSTPQGPAATAYANSIAPPGEYPCITSKPDEFGRLLVDLIVNGQGGLFSDLMLTTGHAVPYQK